MTLQVNGDDIMAVIHVARIVGSIVMAVLIAVGVLWVLRSPRRDRDRREPIDRFENAAADDEALWRVVDRMEERLEVLERALADQTERAEAPRVRGRREDEIFAPADESRDSGRTK